VLSFSVDFTDKGQPRFRRYIIPSRKQFILLLLLSLAAFLILGYHPGCEDAEIYMPGVLKMLHPQLFPVGTEFFESHAHLTLFPNLIASSVRLTHLSLDTVLLFWQCLSIFLLLLACWRLSGKCFNDQRARWAGVALVAALLTLPVAGTALYIVDQYLNPRNLAAFAAIFAIVDVLEKKYIRTALWLGFAASVHPLMAVFAFSYSLLLVAMKSDALTPRKESIAAFGCLLPFGLWFSKPSQAYHQAVQYHSFHYILRWHWYEWLGILAPIALFWWFSNIARKKQLRDLEIMCRALIVYDLIYFAGALVVSIPPRFESLARLQPLRSLHLLYILLLLFGGGLLGEYVLKNKVWRWLALFVPLCGGMFFAQRALFPASSHFEWPWSSPKNEWAQAFMWIRENTPVNAVFAMDPKYMQLDGEDAHGFRVMAQRSRLADILKDSGAVSMFPPLAEEWLQQVQAQTDWKTFKLTNFQRLRADYGVDWVILQQPGITELDCPYQNPAVRVCRVN
jgi:hypothetical protein